METRPITLDEQADIGGIVVTYKCPPELENCQDVEVLFDGEKLWMPWQPNEIEVAQLATGQPIYLLVWGRSLPPVAVRVGIPDEETH